jgi:hypothetical protein
MTFNLIGRSLRRLAYGSALALMLVSCGGGGGSAGTTTNPSSPTAPAATPTIKLTLQNSSGTASNVITLAGPLTALATVLDATGAPVANTVVTFSTAQGYTTFTPTSGSVLTNAKGVATITMAITSATIAQSQAGSADILTASATPTTSATATAITATAPFSLGGVTAGPPTISLALQDSTGASTSLLTTSGPLTALATVRDGNGNPIQNTLVSFSTGLGFTSLSPSSASILTNSSGVATIQLSIASLLIAQTEGGTGDILTANATSGTTVLTATAPFTLGSTAVTLNLAAPNPNPQALSAYGSTLIKVNVLANGVPFTSSPVTVNFASACATSGKAVLPATATTVNGQAQVSYTDKGCSATDAITISVAGATSITATLNVAAPTAASIEFIGATPAGDAIVIQGAGGNGRVQTAVLTFEALDTFGNPLPNETMNFTVNSSQPVDLEATSAVTGANGQATVTVGSGTSPTTFRVIATLPTGQSVISDSISVTTGQPVQTSFSLSAAPAHNIEGWAYDNTQTTLNILLADINGNPVADGTPVVFETDSGAVGSSLDGGCNTTNGGCSVTFRSQNPRFGVGNSAGKRAGLATVNVSTTSQLYTLSGQMGVFLSGSFVDNPVQSPAGTLTLSNCGTAFFTLQLNDLNFNPMPEGTTITATPSTIGGNATAVMAPSNPIFPVAVPDIGPYDKNGNTTLVVANMVADMGSTHTFVFSPGATSGPTVCTAAGTTTTNGTIEVAVTTPKGNVSLIDVNFTYPTP